MKAHILKLFDEVEERLAELRGIAETLPGDGGAPPPEPPVPPVPEPEPPPGNDSALYEQLRTGEGGTLLKESTHDDGRPSGRGAVLLLTKEATGKVDSVWVASHEWRDATDYERLPNGGRLHFRNPGERNSMGSYAGLRLQVHLKDGSWWTGDQITDSMRMEPYRFSMEHEPEPGPGPRPEPIEGVFAYGPGIWFEGGYADLPWAFDGPVNYFSKAPAPGRDAGTHWRVPPWAKQPVWTGNQIMNWLEETRAAGFTGLCIDVEDKFWYAKGYLRMWVEMARDRGMLVTLAPKASLSELSGNPHADVGVKDVDKHLAYYISLGVHGIVAWLYGDHRSHVWADGQLAGAGFGLRERMVLHDHFRNWSGYIGLTEFPKLMAWAAGHPRGKRPLVGDFQPHADTDRKRAGMILGELGGLYL
jgi:hypothetical protein